MKKVIKLFIISVFFILLIGNCTNVFGAEDVQIKITPNTKDLTASDIILIIEITSTKMFDSTSTQAVQILAGEESETNKWTDLGTGSNGVALKKSYNYIVKNNAKISVRVATWTKEDRSDLTEIATQKIEISNIDKTNPVIEKIDTNVSENSISLNIVAKDADSGIAKYTCVCESISYNKTLETSKFDITGLEDNKEYTFNITVEDKIGNKTTTTKKVKTSSSTATTNSTGNAGQTNTTNVVNQTENTASLEQSEVASNEQITNQDNTIANKIIPQVGTKNFFVVLFLVSLISLIFIINKR